MKANADVRRLRRRTDDVRSPGGFAALCRSLIGQGRWSEALAVARDGVRRYPRALELADHLRLLWLRVGRDETQAAEAALEASPTEEAFERLVDLHLEGGELDLAVEVAERFAAAFPGSGDAAVAAAEAYGRRFARDLTAADGAAALAACRRAAGLRPGDADLRCASAEILLMAGAVGAARRELEAAVALAPSHEDAARRLAELPPAEPLATDEDEEAASLVAVEREDRPSAAWMASWPREQDAEAARRALFDELTLFARVAGVRRVAWIDAALRASASQHAEAEESAGDPFVESADVLRTALCFGAKRIGLGAVQEAELAAAGGRVLAYAGAGALLLVDVEPQVRTADLAARARDFVARHDAACEDRRHA
ncbi:MAG TPA: hypothetical protein VEI02_12280 [Planctomycetota bacterium]|nr:hypothetical protein [Planctomycetota bacterium]